MSEENPKLKGSNIIDCIPQSGECPLKCAECYYNNDKFYRSLEPLFPTSEEAKGKIVRVNSGHDSNLSREYVDAKTFHYKDKFYNTAIPNIDFSAPVVLTINGRDTDKTFFNPTQFKSADIGNLMFVRFRVNTWNVALCSSAIMDWTSKGIPLVLTDMRYYSKESIPKKHLYYYEYKKHILNSYWRLNKKGYELIFDFLRFANVYWCGNPFTLNTKCADCRLCELLYVTAKQRIFL